MVYKASPQVVVSPEKKATTAKKEFVQKPNSFENPVDLSSSPENASINVDDSENEYFVPPHVANSDRTDSPPPMIGAGNAPKLTVEELMSDSQQEIREIFALQGKSDEEIA